LSIAARPTLMLTPALISFVYSALEFVAEEFLTRIENFGEGCRCLCAVGLPEGEDVVVAQIS
jgi:hypothetical protein